METNILTVRESAQDVWYGQIVTIVARWFFIATGLLLTYWLADDVQEAMLPSYLLLGLVALNFVLHGRFATGSPMRREVILGACLLDAVIVTALILSSRWDGA